MGSPRRGEHAGAARGVDLNADLGEGVTDDEGLLAVVTSANVACGFHAGDVPTMRAVCEGAVARGVVVGAQVSYADREHFGRRTSTSRATCSAGGWRSRSGRWPSLARAAGTEVAYVKPHGALYNRVADDDGAGGGGARRQRLAPGPGPPGVGGAPAGGGRAVGSTVAEGFPDRGYTPEGRLVPRDAAGRAGGPTRGGPRPGRGGGRAGAVSTRCACTATPRERWRPRSRTRCARGRRAGVRGGLGVDGDRTCARNALPVEHGTTSVGNPVGPEVCRRNPCGAVPGRHRTLPTGTASAGPGIGSEEQLHPATCSPRRPGDGDCGSRTPVRWLGRHHPGQTEGLLMLIPSGAPHHICSLQAARPGRCGPPGEQWVSWTSARPELVPVVASSSGARWRRGGARLGASRWCRGPPPCCSTGCDRAAVEPRCRAGDLATSWRRRAGGRARGDLRRRRPRRGRAPHGAVDVGGGRAPHGARVLPSAFCGFAPGFAYLAGLPEALHVPRRDSRATGCRPAPSAWPDRCAASTRGVAGGLAADRPHRRGAVGRRS